MPRSPPHCSKWQRAAERAVDTGCGISHFLTIGQAEKILIKFLMSAEGIAYLESWLFSMMLGSYGARTWVPAGILTLGFILFYKWWSFFCAMSALHFPYCKFLRLLSRKDSKFSLVTDLLGFGTSKRYLPTRTPFFDPLKSDANWQCLFSF